MQSEDFTLVTDRKQHSTFPVPCPKMILEKSYTVTPSFSLNGKRLWDSLSWIWTFSVNSTQPWSQAHWVLNYIWLLNKFQYGSSHHNYNPWKPGTMFIFHCYTSDTVENSGGFASMEAVVLQVSLMCISQAQLALYETQSRAGSFFMAPSTGV